MSIQSILIVGSGVAAWSAAALLAKQLPQLTIGLLETAIADEATAESTLPSIREFHKLLNLNEREVFQATDTTFRVATRYRDWLRAGDDYWLGVGESGRSIDGIEFQHYATLLHQCGDSTAYDAYSLTVQAARQHKFNPPSAGQQAEGFYLPYGLHLDGTRYQKTLRDYASALGVKSVRGEIAQLELDEASGNIRTLHLKGGEKISADFFIDCTGSVGHLIEAVSTEPFFQHQLSPLLCNKRLAWTEAAAADVPNYSTLSAQASGWQKTIPLRSATHQQYYYHSDFLSDEQALDLVPHAARDAAHTSAIRAGYRSGFWTKNCLALGAASSGLGHLSHAHLHLLHSGLLRFVELFPTDVSPAFAREYNRLTALEHESVMQFEHLPFALSQRDDSDFWRACKTAALPAQLAHRIALFTQRGKIASSEQDPFSVSTWASLFLANKCWPEKYDPLLNSIKLEALQQHSAQLKSRTQQLVAEMPSHAQYLQAYCSTL